MNRIALPIFVCLIGLLTFASCVSDQSRSNVAASLSGNDSDFDSKITVKIDSIKIYPAKESNYLRNFICSPLIHKNKIWFVNSGLPQELDLVTGEWSQLSGRFGGIDRIQIWENGIWKDDSSDEIYIKSRQGIIKYYSDKDRFDYIETKVITSLIFSLNNIVFSSYKGLYILDKNHNTVVPAENFPEDIYIKSIQKSTNDTIVVNNKYYYHISSKSFGEIEMGMYNTGKSKKTKSTKRYSYDILGRKIPKMREFKGENNNWYYNDKKDYRTNELFYTTGTDTIYKFPFFPDKVVTKILEDKNYLYVLSSDQFAVINKEYIFNNSITHDVSDYIKLIREFSQEINVVNASKMNFDEYLAKSVAFYNSDKYDNYRDLLNMVKSTPRSFEHNVFKIELEKLNAILKNDTIPDMFKFYISKGVSRRYLVKGQLDSTMIYLNLADELSAAENDECLKWVYPCVNRTVSYLDSLGNENLSPDKLLFLEANAKAEMIRCCCSWFGDSYYDFSIIAEKYQELRTKYPNSEYADDAEYWFISTSSYPENEGGDYHLDEIPEIRKFLTKYPNSEFIPAIVQNMASSYSANAYPSDIEKSITNLSKGIEMLEELKINYSLDTLESASVERDLAKYLKYKNDLIDTMNIRSQRGW